MTVEKKKRLVSSLTATAVIVFVFLVGVLLFVSIKLRVEKKRFESIQAEWEELNEAKKKMDDEKDLWLQEWKIEERARQIGWKKPNEN